MNLTFEEKGERVLAVLYSLSKGIVGIQIKKRDLLNECNRLQIMHMTREQFQTFKTETVNQHQKQSVN